MNILELTLFDAHKALTAGDFTVRQLVDACLENINTKNEDLNVFLHIHTDIDEQVVRAQSMIDAGEATELTGIPIALKANIMRTGQIANASSKILENYKATYDATVVERLEQQGVIFMGSTNMDEFAMGSSTENSAYGPTKNPHDTSRVPGGSSGGSAAAVASGMALVALGTDTGGSIRQPAALCGIVGSKTTYGAVSRHGAIAMGSSLDQIGPFTKTVQEAALLTEIMAGKDDFDMTSIDTDWKAPEQKTYKFLLANDGFDQVESDVKDRCNALIEKIKNEGHTVDIQSVPSLQYGLPVYYISMPAEVSSNLARYDGIRYGERKDGDKLLATYLNSKSEGFGAESKRRIMLGTYILSKGYEDRLYTQAIALKEDMKAEAAKVFEQYDAIITPTTLAPAFKFGEKTDNPLDMYAEDLFTVSANIIGAPAISIPMGTVDRDGIAMPVGFHIMSNAGDDAKMFAIAASVEHLADNQ
jgi:aspartyl-tRNA(Asn)/glutamyl-tRNA(Gln) amidotransferase subunit A